MIDYSKQCQIDGWRGLLRPNLASIYSDENILRKSKHFLVVVTVGLIVTAVSLIYGVFAYILEIETVTTSQAIGLIAVTALVFLGLATAYLLLLVRRAEIAWLLAPFMPPPFGPFPPIGGFPSAIPSIRPS